MNALLPKVKIVKRKDSSPVKQTVATRLQSPSPAGPTKTVDTAPSSVPDSESDNPSPTTTDSVSTPLKDPEDSKQTNNYEDDSQSENEDEGSVKSQAQSDLSDQEQQDLPDPLESEEKSHDAIQIGTYTFVENLESKDEIEIDETQYVQIEAGDLLPDPPPTRDPPPITDSIAEDGVNRPPLAEKPPHFLNANSEFLNKSPQGVRFRDPEPVSLQRSPSKRESTKTSEYDHLKFKSPPSPVRRRLAKFMMGLGDHRNEDTTDPEISFRSQYRGSGPPDEANQIARALVAHQGLDRHIKKVGICSGADKDKTLQWVRAVDLCPMPLEVARETAEGPLLATLMDHNDAPWHVRKEKILKIYVSPAFDQMQRDALEVMRQRPAEPTRVFAHEFKQVVTEAYPKPPEDQRDLVRTFLSALNDRQVAKSIIKKNPLALQEAIDLVLAEVDTESLLKPLPTQGKAHATDPTVETLAKITKVVSELAAGQERLVGKMAALQQAPPSRTSPPSGPCYRCGQSGHWARQCRMGASPRAPSTSPQTSSSPPLKSSPPSSSNKAPAKSVPAGEQKAIRCHRCHRPGHMVRNCNTPPPKRPCHCGGFHWFYDCQKAPPNQ